MTLHVVLNINSLTLVKQSNMITNLQFLRTISTLLCPCLPTLVPQLYVIRTPCWLAVNINSFDVFCLQSTSVAHLSLKVHKTHSLINNQHNSLDFNAFRG